MLKEKLNTYIAAYLPPFHDTYPPPPPPHPPENEKNWPLGNIAVPNSPATTPHHFSKGLYFAHALVIRDWLLNLSGSYPYALLCDPCPFLGIVICGMIAVTLAKQCVCLLLPLIKPKPQIP